MQVIYGLNRIKKYRKPVVALGVFDGVHRGHRKILKDVVTEARRIHGTSMVLTFWPHPQKEESVYSLEHRLRLIRELGVDVCIVIRFNKTFAEISAEDFIKKILIKKIGTSYVYVGENFRFGKAAKGNLKALYKLSSIYNFKLKTFHVIKINNKPISSTYIRRLIKKGDLAVAQSLLSRPVSIFGTVVRGISLARKLGFPTANINPHHEVLPPRGIYTVGIIFNNKKFSGISYIGSRPTFLSEKFKTGDKKSKINVEVYIFNFNKNIYGKNLEIQFIKKIRNEKKFSSQEALASQVKNDILRVKKMFTLH